MLAKNLQQLDLEIPSCSQSIAGFPVEKKIQTNSGL